MLAVLDRSLPVRATSWMRSDAAFAPAGRHVALAPGVLILREAVRRASEMADEALTAPPPQDRGFDPPQWHERAACVGRDWEEFFSEDRKVRVTLANQSKKLCRACPVAASCLDHALVQREEFGIWAGTSGLQRKSMLARVDSGLTDVAQEIDTWFAKP